MRSVPRIALGLVVLTLGVFLPILEYGYIGLDDYQYVVLHPQIMKGLGLDSLIECAAAGVLLWRLDLETRGVDSHTLERTERRVHRFVGATFLALAAYVTAQSTSTLWQQEVPDQSWIGIALAAASLVIMPLVSWGKLRAAREIRSAALRAEAKETLACSYLSLALLLGLLANATGGWWWADPVAALAMVPWLVHEGMEGLRGQSCEDD